VNTLFTKKHLKVKSVRDLGLQFVKNDQRMCGQDGAFSIPIEGGSTLWFFGDTLVGERTPEESLWYPGGTWVGHSDMSGKGKIEHMINNTGLVLPAQTGVEGLHGFEYITDAGKKLRPLIPLENGEDPNWIRVWCLHGIYLRPKVYLYFIKIKMLPEGPLPANFEIIGSGLAEGTPDDWNFKRVFHNGTDVLWKKNQPQFAAAVLKPENSAYVYLYGARNTGDADGLQRCYLARVKPDKLTDLASYEYLASGSPGWSDNIEEAVPLFSGMPNEMSVSFNAHLGCYLSVHSFDLTGKIVGRTSREPWGPWSEPVELYNVKTDNRKPLPYHRLIYAGKEHPALAGENGKIIYVTYIEFEEYFPHLIEMTLE